MSKVYIRTPTMGGIEILPPPCVWKFQNALPPQAFGIPDSFTPPSFGIPEVFSTPSEFPIQSTSPPPPTRIFFFLAS